MSRDRGRRDKARQTSYHTMRLGWSSEQTEKVFMELRATGQGGWGWGGRGGGRGEALVQRALNDNQ